MHHIPDLSRLLRPEAVTQFAVFTGMALVSLWTTPREMSGGDTTLVVIAAIVAGIALAAIRATQSEDSADIRFSWHAIAFAGVVLATVLAIVVRPLGGLALLVVLAFLVWLQARSLRVSRLAMIAIVPWWVWIAADAWYWQLLMLVFMQILALVATAQLHDAGFWPEDTERIMSARAHRYAGWLVVALAGVLVVSIGWVADIGKPWLALAGVTLAAAIPLEAGFGATPGEGGRRSSALVYTAFTIASISWLIGIA
ncbi:MAG: hypothetical protein KC435_03160 [Thermomicrobiales bacterium]|nr:hypothetical protein [Thermomicrobiales bacterium]